MFHFPPEFISQVPFDAKLLGVWGFLFCMPVSLFLNNLLLSLLLVFFFFLKILFNFNKLYLASFRHWGCQWNRPGKARGGGLCRNERTVSNPFQIQVRWCSIYLWYLLPKTWHSFGPRLGVLSAYPNGIAHESIHLYFCSPQLLSLFYINGRN